MAADGVEYLSYFQVDNPLVPIADPLFIGLHILEGSQISSRMLPKTCRPKNSAISVSPAAACT